MPTASRDWLIDIDVRRLGSAPLAAAFVVYQDLRFVRSGPDRQLNGHKQPSWRRFNIAEFSRDIAFALATDRASDSHKIHSGTAS